MNALSISEVAARTGVAPGTLRMWEQRYGFPVPERTPSGYRRYPGEVVTDVRRVVELRARGLSMAAAISRARDRASDLPTDRASLYAAVAGASGVPPQVLRKRTLIAVSRAIEDEAIASASSPVAFGAFQQEGFYRAVEHRWRELARMADAACVFFGGTEAIREPPGGGAVEVPIGAADALGNEWALIVDAPGFSACLLAWEPPSALERGGPRDLERRFETIWTVDPEVTRQAAGIAARLAGRADVALGARLEALLADRPLALDQPAPALAALTNRMVAYLERFGFG